MEERRRGEAHDGSEAAEREPAQFCVRRAQLRERGSLREQRARRGRVERDDRHAASREERHDGWRHRRRPCGEDVRRPRREHEPREAVRERARFARMNTADRAQLPGVDHGVSDGIAAHVEDEEPWITARREMFDHRGLGSSRGSRRCP